MENLGKIERYINGELEEDDLWEFKRALESDPQLAAELKDYLMIKKLLSQKEKLKLMDKMNAIHEAEKSRSKLPRIPIYAAAASFLLLASIGGFLLLRHSGSNEAALFNQYYTAESGAFGLRSGHSSLQHELAQGLQYYEDKNFEKAIDFFNQTDNNLMARLYRGISYLELEQFDKALSDFDVVIADNNNLFVDQAQWYKALTLLKSEQLTKAKETLNAIASDRSVYKTKAQKLLKELEN